MAYGLSRLQLRAGQNLAVARVADLGINGDLGDVGRKVGVVGGNGWLYSEGQMLLRWQERGTLRRERKQ